MRWLGLVRLALGQDWGFPGSPPGDWGIPPTFAGPTLGHPELPFDEWVHRESRVCPLRGTHNNPDFHLTHGRCHRPRCQYSQAFSLKEAPVDGSCRFPQMDSCPSCANTNVGSLFPEDVRAGFIFGESKLRHGHSKDENEHWLSLQWQRAINRVVAAKTYGLQDLSEVMTAVGQMLDHDLLDLDHQKNDCERSKSCDHSGSCLKLRILGDPEEVTHRIYQKHCVSRGRFRFCEGQPGNMELVNKQTGWLDASNIYGSSMHDELHHRGGAHSALLRLDYDPRGNPFFPFSNHLTDCEGQLFCRCFDTGDWSVSETPNLTSFTLVLAHYHNLIASNLSAALSAQQRFGLARELLIYSWQKIVMEEYLPELIGPTLTNFFKHPIPSNPGLTKDFSIMYRVHELIPESAVAINGQGQFTYVRSLTTGFFEITPTLKEGSRSFVRGALRNAIFNRRGTFLANTTQNVLANRRDTGFDLLAINVARSRELGLPPYSCYFGLAQQVLRAAGLRGPQLVRGFRQPLPKGSPPRTPPFRCATGHAPILRQSHTVDAYLGGLAEEPVEPGAVLGGTRAVVVGLGIAGQRDLDPLFYTKRVNYPLEAAFAQVNLHLLVCTFLITSGSGQEFAPRNPFRVPSDQNPLIPCQGRVNHFRSLLVAATHS